MATTESNLTKEGNSTNERNKTKLLKIPLMVDLDREKEVDATPPMPMT